MGSGAFAKVIQATRLYDNEDTGEEEKEEYALKKMHKPTLKRARAARYDENGKMQNIDNLAKVYNEIDVWTKCIHPSIVRIYEMIDADDHDYLYIIMELAELGQLATWNSSIAKYERTKEIVEQVETILADPEKYLPEPGSKLAKESELRKRLKKVDVS